MVWSSLWLRQPGRQSEFSRATAFRQGFFACGKTALSPLPARATAFRQGFFACGKTALSPLPALATAFRKKSDRDTWPGRSS